MSRILTITDTGLEGLQPTDTFQLGPHSVTATAVYETDTTQNGTYNSEPAYEGNGYWIFKSGNYWCKNDTKTNNYWDCEVVALTTGGYGFENDTINLVALPISDGTTNYFGDLVINQSASFNCVAATHLLGCHFSISTDDIAFNAIGNNLSYSWCLEELKLPAYEANVQAKTTLGLIVGDNDVALGQSVNRIACGASSGYYNYIEGNCQALSSVNSDTKVDVDTINSCDTNSVTIVYNEYHTDYVRTRMESGTSFPASPAEGELFYRTDHRNMYLYDGSTWMVPTEGFPKYSENNWSAFKQAWGRIIPRWKGTLFKTPKLTELSGNYGSYNGVRWQCALTLDDGDIIVMPRNETNVLRIHSANDTVNSSVNISGNQNIYAAAYYSGNIYGYSVTAAQIVKFNPSDNSIVRCTSNLSGYYYGGVLYNDCIYFVEAYVARVIKFDPSDNSVATINYGGNSYSPNYTANMCLAADNCMYILPYRTDDFIIKFDPETETFEEIEIALSSVNTADKRWYGFMNGPDGCMYITPATNGKYGTVYNPFTGEWSELSGNTIPGYDAYIMGAVHPSGKIVFGPGGDNDAIFIVDTETKTGTILNKTASMNTAQRQLQVAGNGNIYGFPAWHNTTNAYTIWKIQLGEPMDLDPHFATSIYMDS